MLHRCALATLCRPYRVNIVFVVYVQEIGRAGRDSLQSSATLLYQNSDISANVTHVTQDMKEFCKYMSCRRVKLMSYFNQESTFTGPKCLCCDVCKMSCSCVNCS